MNKTALILGIAGLGAFTFYYFTKPNRDSDQYDAGHDGNALEKVMAPIVTISQAVIDAGRNAPAGDEVKVPFREDVTEEDFNYVPGLGQVDTYNYSVPGSDLTDRDINNFPVPFISQQPTYDSRILDPTSKEKIADESTNVDDPEGLKEEPTFGSAIKNFFYSFNQALKIPPMESV